MFHHCLITRVKISASHLWFFPLFSFYLHAFLYISIGSRFISFNLSRRERSKPWGKRMEPRRKVAALIKTKTFFAPHWPRSQRTQSQDRETSRAIKRAKWIYFLPLGVCVRSALEEGESFSDLGSIREICDRSQPAGVAPWFQTSLALDTSGKSCERAFTHKLRRNNKAKNVYRQNALQINNFSSSSCHRQARREKLGLRFSSVDLVPLKLTRYFSARPLNKLLEFLLLSSI